MVLTHMHTDQWDRIKNPEMSLYFHDQFIYDPKKQWYTMGKAASSIKAVGKLDN